MLVCIGLPLAQRHQLAFQPTLPSSCFSFVSPSALSYTLPLSSPRLEELSPPIWGGVRQQVVSRVQVRGEARVTDQARSLGIVGKCIKA